jgi:hypothetical protein
MIQTLPTKAYEIFKDTGRLPIALHILTSGDRRKINNFAKVCELLNIKVEDVINSME